MNDIGSNAVVLVHLASFLYVLAFIVRDQLTLRVLVLIATAFYITYYYFVPAVPLWDAIAWSVILGIANIYVTIQILLERTTFRLSAEEQELYSVFDALQPGEFRKLLRITSWHQDQPQRLTTEGHRPDKLFYVLSGDVSVDKNGNCSQLDAGMFVGEVAYFLDGPASATVSLPSGGRYVAWSRADLEQLERKQPAIRVALDKLINKDLARKLALSSV